MKFLDAPPPRRIARRHFLGGAVGLLAGNSLAAGPVGAPQRRPRRARYNVLFVAIDDLRPELACYGSREVVSPNIDRLARRGLVFERAYCQQAVCNPSRASLLTGRRPDTTRVYDLRTHFRRALPGVNTLPERFKNNGYQARCVGKIFHDDLEDAASWSAPKLPDRNAGMQYVDTAKLEQLRRERGEIPAHEIPTLTWRKRESWQAPDVPDNALQDGQTADQAISILRSLRRGERFFLAVGFQKPHLPFVAPRKYFDLYPPHLMRATPAARGAPANVPAIALHPWTELRGYTDIPKEGALTESKALELKRGYYAGISYADAQLGRVVDELDRLKLSGETVVAVWGDHGFHLGEHDLWAKTSNFELDARAPLILCAPDQRANGRRTNALVELVDIYPTLCELCDLPPSSVDLEGTSMVPLLRDPTRTWKRAAFTQHPGTVTNGLERQAMGRTVRTDRYRYTEWAEIGKAPAAVELYDHSTDPGETVNVAANPENEAVVSQLSETLRRGWRGALPPRK